MMLPTLVRPQEDVNRDHLFNVSGGDPANTQSADQRARLLNATDREAKNTKLLDDARRQLVWCYCGCFSFLSSKRRTKRMSTRV